MAIATTTAPDAFGSRIFDRAPRNVYWEMTQACALACQHCRADAGRRRDPGELTTPEARVLIDTVARMGSMLVLTGGDPLERSDLFELLAYARAAHVPVAITPSTTPRLTRQVVERFAEAGITAMGVSLDGHCAATHDAFRNVAGTFDRAMLALQWARECGVPVQVNSTITAQTVEEVAQLYALLSRFSPPVRRWSLFMLVPVGRGAALQPPAPDVVERLFAWVYETNPQAPFHISTVEAPHYRRYFIERRLAEGAAAGQLAKVAGRMAFGLRDGNGVVFVSHLGEVHPAGFLPEPIGNVRHTPLDELYSSSPRLAVLRDMDRLGGTCGGCDYRWACGGSRARAFTTEGDAMASDPLCSLVAG